MVPIAVWVGLKTVGRAFPPPAFTFTAVVNELLVTSQRYCTSPFALFKAVIAASVTRLPVPGWNTRTFDSPTDETLLACAL